LRLLILVAREGFLKDKCGPRAKKFEYHCSKPTTQYHQTICAVKSNPAHLQHSQTLEKQESKGGYFN